MSAVNKTINKMQLKWNAKWGVVLLLLSSPLGWAAEYRAEGKLEVAARHDDNINLGVSNQDSVYGELVNPAGKLWVKTENWDTSLNVDLKFSDFNRSGYDSDDQYVDLVSDWAGEKSTFSLSAKAAHDTTRTSEAEDSGRFSNERRKLYSLAPSWSYSITDKNLVTLSATASLIDYSADDYTGYTNGQVYAEWTHVYTENLRFFLRANAKESEFDEKTQFNSLFVQVVDTPVGPVTNPEFTDQTYVTTTFESGLQFGASYQFTENLNFYGLFGSSESDTEYDITDEFDACAITLGDPVWVVRGICEREEQDFTSRTKTIDTSISWSGERQTFSLGYNTRTQPSSDGYVLEFEKLNLNWKYELSKKNSVTAVALWGENTALEAPDAQLQTSSSNREYSSFTLSYTHRLTERWRTSASFRYRFQDREKDDGTAEATGARLSISYRPQTKQW